MLLESTSKGNITEVAQLLEEGAPHSTRGVHREIPLMNAASCGHAEMVRLLLDKGAKVSDLRYDLQDCITSDGHQQDI